MSTITLTIKFTGLIALIPLQNSAEVEKEAYAVFVKEGHAPTLYMCSDPVTDSNCMPHELSGEIELKVCGENGSACKDALLDAEFEFGNFEPMLHVKGMGGKRACGQPKRWKSMQRHVGAWMRIQSGKLWVRDDDKGCIDYKYCKNKGACTGEICRLAESFTLDVELQIKGSESLRLVHGGGHYDLGRDSETTIWLSNLPEETGEPLDHLPHMKLLYKLTKGRRCNRVPFTKDGCVLGQVEEGWDQDECDCPSTSSGSIRCPAGLLNPIEKDVWVR